MWIISKESVVPYAFLLTWAGEWLVQIVQQIEEKGSLSPIPEDDGEETND